MNRYISTLLFACGTAFAAPERLPQFRHMAVLALEGEGAIYTLALPVEVYRGLARRDLGDLRVLNGAGEVVPHALLGSPASEKKPAAPVAMNFFPLYGPAGRAVEDIALRVERKPDGTLSAVVAPGRQRAASRRILGYIIDASAVSAEWRELRFDWPAGAEGASLHVRVEASDDLKTWRAVASGPLIVLRQGELLLERRDLQLPPTKAKYFRLAWRPADEPFKLASVAAVPVDAVSATPRSWLRVAGTAGAKPGEFTFELPASLPVDRLRFELPNENTVATVALAVQERSAGPERALRSATLYRMEHRGEKLNNPDLEVRPTQAPRWVMRVDARGGGLGSGLPVMHAGWLPHRLVFVARGEPPFRAAFGDPDAAPASLAVQTLVPGYDPDKPLPALPARVGPVVSHEPAKSTPAETVRGYFARMDAKKMWLWGSLVLAVLVIVGMALRLTQQLPTAGESERPQPSKKPS